MHAELPVLSFVCIPTLAILLPLRHARTSAAIISIIVWLLVCSSIHGVNSLVWAQSTMDHIPVWCDIVTRVLLGANVALPAACLCLCRRLELFSSSRKINHEPEYTRNRTILEISLCAVLPVIYIIFYTIVQDHRFNIVEDFGCEASIYSSVPSIIIIWLPPLLLCIIGFVYCGLTLHHFLQRRATFSQHLESRSDLSTSHFIRLLVISILQLCLLSILFIFGISAQISSGLREWLSWNQVHSAISDAGHVDLSSLSDVERALIQFSWWIIPVLSLLCVGTCTLSDMKDFVRNASGCLRKSKRDLEQARFESWLDMSDLPKSPHSPKRPIVVSSPRVKPIILKSGWDDTMKSNSSESKPLALLSPKSEVGYSPPSSPEDAAFTASTISYLQSPTGQKALEHSTPLPVLPPPPPRSQKPRKQKHRASVISATTSFFRNDAAWPLPPSTIPDSPTSPRSPSGSASSPIPEDDANRYTPRVSVTPPTPPDRPVYLSNATPLSDGAILPPPPSHRVRRQSSRSRGESRRKRLSPDDVIYMTAI